MSRCVSLAAYLSQLISLRISRCVLLYCVVTLYKKIPPNLLEAWQRLKVLRLEHNGLGGEGICSLSKPIALFHGLTILQLGANRIGQHNTAGAAALSRALAQGPAPTLRVLGLGENNLGPEGLQVLAPALRALRSLQHLDLNANRLAAKGATTLAEAMGSCSSLTTLALNFNFLGEHKIHGAGAWRAVVVDKFGYQFQ